jgi:fumarylacetoacetate (FAA) hydrolase family protein
VSLRDTHGLNALDRLKINECCSNIKVIKRFDENIQLRALKTDLSEIIQSFKLYVKERVFIKGVNEIKE